MNRLRDWVIIATRALASRVRAHHHLTTDPACTQYRAPRHGSRLDRASRGHACTKCQSTREWQRATHLSGTGV